MLVAAVFALPAMAGWNTAGINKDATTIQQAFHSTSTMQGSGSTYYYQPAGLNDEGRATYSDPYAAAEAPSGPRRIGGFTPTTDPMPVGDAVLPLLLFAAAFGGMNYMRRRRAQISPQI